MIACSLWMALTFGLPWAIQSLFGVTNFKRVGQGVRWGHASKQGIFAGGMSRMSPRFGTTAWFSKTRWCQCWSMVRGVRQMEGIGVVHPSLLNVSKEFGERVGMNHQYTLAHILGMPSGPSFGLGTYRLSLQSPWAVFYKSTCPKGRWWYTSRMLLDPAWWYRSPW